MVRIGYARVSTLDQDLDGQLARLTAEVYTLIRSEKLSGGSREGRTELATVIEFLRAGDGLMVARLDRLGRDTRDVLKIIHEVEQRGSFVTVLDPYVSTQGPIGHVMLTVLEMVAQMERRFIRERQCEGIARAKGTGTYLGGKRRLNPSEAKPCTLRALARPPSHERCDARGCRSTVCCRRADRVARCLGVAVTRSSQNARRGSTLSAKDGVEHAAIAASRGWAEWGLCERGRDRGSGIGAGRRALRSQRVPLRLSASLR